MLSVHNAATRFASFGYAVQWAQEALRDKQPPTDYGTSTHQQMPSVRSNAHAGATDHSHGHRNMHRPSATRRPPSLFLLSILTLFPC